MKKKGWNFRGKRRGRGREKNQEIDITSLLDILVIIIVFLLKTYTVSILVNPAEGIKLPLSQSEKNFSPGVTLQVSQNKLWLEEKEILDFTQEKEESWLTPEGHIAPLLQALEEYKSVETPTKDSQDKSAEKKVVNLIMDRTIPYTLIKKIMNTCAASTLDSFKFAVLKES